VTAAEASARRNVDFRARVCAAAHAGTRALKDLLKGFESDSKTATRLRSALVAEGVDLSTIPKRSPAEVQAWKKLRQPHLSNALPAGYAIEKCGCGREFPRAIQAAEDCCWKCRWKRETKWERELADAHAEIEGLRERLGGVARPVLNSLPGGKA
jgi:hypothetical protein